MHHIAEVRINNSNSIYDGPFSLSHYLHRSMGAFLTCPEEKRKDQ